MKIRKIIIILISIILITVLSIITYNVFAEENITIVDIEYSNDIWHSSILYSDNRLLMWSANKEEKIVENVKKRAHTNNMSFQPDYLTYNNELYYNSNTQGKIKKIENVVDFETGMIAFDKVIAYKDTNNTLFYIKYDEYSEKELRLQDFKTYNFLEMLDIYSIEHSITDYEENDNQIPVYVIFLRGCGACKEFMNYLSTLDSTTYNKIKIIGLDIEDYDNEEIFDAVTDMYDFDDVEGTPIILVGEKNLVGLSDRNKHELLSEVDYMSSQSINDRYDFIKEYNKSKFVEPVEIAKNVKEFTINNYSYYGSIIYTTTDNNAYVFGDVCYNDLYYCEYDNESYLLLENVKKIDKYYLITENNELYILPTSSSRLRPTETDVSRVIDYTYDYNGRYIVETPEGTQKVIFYQNDTNSFTSYYGQEIRDTTFRNQIYYDTIFTLTTDGKLYTENLYYEERFTEIKTDVKEIIQSKDSDQDDLLILYNNGELHYLCYDKYSCYPDEFVEKMIGKDYVESNTEFLVLKDVETIKYYNDQFILMNDKSVYRYGDNRYNEFKGISNISESYIPVQIDELINNGKEIKMKEMLFTLDDNKTSVDDILYYNIDVIPANTTGKKQIYIEDKSIVKEENRHLRGLKEGQTEVCGIIGNDEETKVCKNIQVYPKINSISIEEEEITLKEYETKVITINYSPNNTLKNDLDLDCYIEGKKCDTEDGIEIDFQEYYDYEMGEYYELQTNQIAITGWTGGTYTLELYQRECDSDECYDTITINVEEDVRNIQLEIDEEYFDGYYNAYMFINEKETLQVNYKVINETATNKKVYFHSQNTSIATIDENGLITAHQPGKTEISISTEAGNTIEYFYLTVYDYTKLGSMKGDANQDGEVNILDVIKLRKYLAGLEDLES